ncbi:MAG: SUMF1/EgtB/PvdO family nonheme iron enzyme [Caldilineaceae bacterium]|nr:SUMF1/EgtB/PvdO family nonheme iron enzyme [Caldilineaceae bacterium]MBP8108120.1 SUMF1/EgtB/PvdO family nonheme iron enzyme [Caldilineaceae bacterium]MBP8123078.1 SUMF1/EgtB/PvdO family nonheme iron enzyme [Caldilineaceae bacterium]MBP9070725.1 SUMF1/EgtB/PvdO family nonheme iron enzyme [Caldilineaceae bacterium]
MDLNTWKEAVARRLTDSARFLKKMTPDSLYGMLAASSLLPVIAAANGGDFAAVAALTGVVGGIGGNLIANQIQAWKDTSENALAAELGELATTDPRWRDALDAVLVKLETPRIMQTLLAEADKDWFARTLRQELVNLGNEARYEALLEGSGAIAQGETATAAGADGIAVGGQIGGDQIVQIVKVYMTAPGQPTADADTFAQALDRYLAWVAKRYGQLDLRGIDRRERQVLSLTLDDVYVSLMATVTEERKPSQRKGGQRRQPEIERMETTELQTVDMRQLLAMGSRLEIIGSPGSGKSWLIAALQTVDMRQLLAMSPRLAIIGGPGSGKTTYLYIIAAGLAHALRSGDRSAVDRHLGLIGDLPLPIFVSLSDYNRYRRQCEESDDPHKSTLTAFITHNLIRQEAALGLPLDFFQRLLVRGHSCIVLLDGLDEVADERERSLVRRAVENLAANQGIGHLVVTSRSRAHQGRAVLSEEFRLAKVQPMTLEQAQALAARWCAAAYNELDITKESLRLQQAIAGLEAMRRARQEPGLVDSPLMVTIVAIVHYNQRRLPDERAELYDKCIEVLLAEQHHPETPAMFDLADWGGNLRDKRNLLAYLAFRMMSAGAKVGRVAEEGQIEEWLRPRLVKRWGEAEAAIRLAAFVRAMRERGSILDERGGVYQFIHLTFQEFLCATYLADSVRVIDEVVEILFQEGRVADSWWRETVLLTAGYLHLRSTDAPLAFLQALLDYSVQDSALALAVAEVAATALLELDSQDPVIKGKIIDRLIGSLTVNQLRVEAKLRAAAGVALGKLGDPRPGVGLKDGLPDIAWLPVEPGPFIMGSEKHNFEKPQFTCHLIAQPYGISRYPITVVQYAVFAQAKGYEQRKYWNEAGWSWRIKNNITGPEIYDGVFQTSNHPQVGVSWFEAVAFCNWLSEQLDQKVCLPTEAEWERAARHTDGREYPWGNKWDQERCNNTDLHIGFRTAVGIFPTGDAQCGAADMSGNVWEWCSTKWRDNYQGYEEKVDNTLDGDGLRILRGGSFAITIGGVRCADRLGDNPDLRDWVSGFRVVSSSSTSPDRCLTSQNGT